MKFYHGSTSPEFLRKARKVADVFTHGFEFTPKERILSTDEDFFLDNGAFTDDFNQDKWISTMEKFSQRKNEPDFVVLPDTFDDPMATFMKAQKYRWKVSEFEFDYYYAVQKPKRFERDNKTAIHRANEISADGIFIGGSWDWKKENASELVDLAHDEGLKAHIGMPKNIFWAWNTGADSLDTTNISRNKDFRTLRAVNSKIKQQSHLVDFV
jgi:hypothetical protein